MSNENEQQEPKLYGICMYDVPTHMKQLYGKIRKALGPNSILQTWSCRMFPWALRDQVENALEEINEELPRSSRVRYRILFLDKSQSEEHEQMVFEALQRLLRAMHNNLRNRIKSADEKIAEAEEAGEAPKTPMDKARRVAVRKARNDLKEARRLALLFDAEGALEDAFDAYNKILNSEEKLGAYRPSQADSESEEEVDEEGLTPQERADKETADFEKKMAWSE